MGIIGIDIGFTCLISVAIYLCCVLPCSHGSTIVRVRAIQLFG